MGNRQLATHTSSPNRYAGHTHFEQKMSKK
jgi:hypothetical protein